MQCNANGHALYTVVLGILIGTEQCKDFIYGTLCSAHIKAKKPKYFQMPLLWCIDVGGLSSNNCEGINDRSPRGDMLWGAEVGTKSFLTRLHE
jgi:hypothetical protein